MRKTIRSIRLAAPYLSGVTLLTLLAGCAGDGLLLPGDGEPAELRMVSGDRQSALAGDPVPDPLVVEAVDRNGRPVVGAPIVFAFVDPRSGALLAPGSAETGGDGRASAEVTLGTPAGDQSVEARLDGSGGDLKVRFRLTALQPKGGGGAGNGGDNGGGGDDGQVGGGGGGDRGKGKGHDGKGKGHDDGKDKDEGHD